MGPEGTKKGLEKFKLNSGGVYELVGVLDLELQPSGTTEEDAAGVTVDSRGNIYAVSGSENLDGQAAVPVYEFRKVVEKVVNGGKEEFVEKLEGVKIPHHLGHRNEWGYVAVDDSGDLYLGVELEGGAKEGYVGVPKLTLGGAGEVLSENVFAPVLVGARRPVAVDRSTGAVFVGDGSSIAEYSSSGALQLTFGSMNRWAARWARSKMGWFGSRSNSVTGRIYVANPLHQDVDVFGPVADPPGVCCFAAGGV